MEPMPQALTRWAHLPMQALRIARGIRHRPREISFASRLADGAAPLPRKGRTTHTRTSMPLSRCAPQPPSQTVRLGSGTSHLGGQRLLPGCSVAQRVTQPQRVARCAAGAPAGASWAEAGGLRTLAPRSAAPPPRLMGDAVTTARRAPWKVRSARIERSGTGSRTGTASSRVKTHCSSGFTSTSGRLLGNAAEARTHSAMIGGGYRRKNAAGCSRDSVHHRLAVNLPQRRSSGPTPIARQSE